MEKGAASPVIRTFRSGAQKLLLQSVASCFGNSRWCSNRGSASLFVAFFTARRIVRWPYRGRTAIGLVRRATRTERVDNAPERGSSKRAQPHIGAGRLLTAHHAFASAMRRQERTKWSLKGRVRSGRSRGRQRGVEAMVCRNRRSLRERPGRGNGAQGRSYKSIIRPWNNSRFAVRFFIVPALVPVKYLLPARSQAPPHVRYGAIASPSEPTGFLPKPPRSD